MFCLGECMKKLGRILLIAGVILIVLISGAGIYLYNFHVFKTVRLCVGEANNLKVPCGVTSDCIDLMTERIESELSDAPSFIQEKFEGVIEEVVYCDKSCFLKSIRGINLETGEFEMLDSCEAKEKEIIIEIRGKEGLEILRYLVKEKKVK